MYEPLVSAIMLTRNRFKFLKGAIDDFVKQDYEHKELVIVNSGSFLYRKRVKKLLVGINATVVHIETPPLSIGELRNLAIKACSGEYCMTFDDDDYHHPQRMSKQIDICLRSNVDATMLKNFIASMNGDRYLCNFKHGLEGTILFKKPERVHYMNISQGEDTYFVKELKENKYNIIVLDEPHEMYEYRFHGKNTVSKEHFSKIINKVNSVKQMAVEVS